ncbi:MAG TPA: DUF1559 domain-containing protein [Capsulimonadaceae bacterium]
MFPVFATARDKARQTTCTSNAKQIMIGVLQYTQDYDEVLPPIYTSGATFQMWYMLVAPYEKSSGVFLCPSDPDPLVDVTSGTADSFLFNYHLAGTSVAKVAKVVSTVCVAEGGAQAGTGGATNNTTVDTSTAKRKSWILQDPDPVFAYKTCKDSTNIACAASLESNATGWAGPAARHAQRSTTGFVDGHVKALKPEQYYYTQSPWLYPAIGG